MGIGDAAFEAVARVLPSKLRQAIASDSIEELQEALDTVQRTYQTFPERESAEVHGLRTDCNAQIKMLRKATATEMRARLGRAKSRLARLQALEAVAADASADQNLRFVAKTAHDEMYKELVSDLNHRLDHFKGLEVLEQYDQVLSGSGDDAVKFVAGQKRSAVKATLDRLASKDKAKKLEGEVGVAAALIGLSNQLSRVLESDDVMAQEEILERVEMIQELAQMRGIEMPAQVDQTAFDQTVRQIKRKQVKLEADANASLDARVAQLAEERGIDLARIPDLVHALEAEIEVLREVLSRFGASSGEPLGEKALVLCESRLEARQKQLQEEVQNRQLLEDTAEFERRLRAQDPKLDIKERLHNIWSDPELRDGVKRRAREDWEAEWAAHWVGECEGLMPGGKASALQLEPMKALRDKIEEFYRHHKRTPVAVQSKKTALNTAIMKIGRGEIKAEMSAFEQKKARIKLNKVLKQGIDVVKHSGVKAAELQAVLDSCLSQAWQGGMLPAPLHQAVKEAARLTGGTLPEYLQGPGELKEQASAALGALRDAVHVAAGVKQFAAEALAQQQAQQQQQQEEEEMLLKTKAAAAQMYESMLSRRWAVLAERAQQLNQTLVEAHASQGWNAVRGAVRHLGLLQYVKNSAKERTLAEQAAEAAGQAASAEWHKLKAGVLAAGVFGAAAADANRTRQQLQERADAGWRTLGGAVAASGVVNHLAASAQKAQLHRDSLAARAELLWSKLRHSLLSVAVLNGVAREAAERRELEAFRAALEQRAEGCWHTMREGLLAAAVLHQAGQDHRAEIENKAEQEWGRLKAALTSVEALGGLLQDKRAAQQAAANMAQVAEREWAVLRDGLSAVTRLVSFGDHAAAERARRLAHVQQAAGEAWSSLKRGLDTAARLNGVAQESAQGRELAGKAALAWRKLQAAVLVCIDKDETPEETQAVLQQHWRMLRHAVAGSAAMQRAGLEKELDSQWDQIRSRMVAAMQVQHLAYTLHEREQQAALLRARLDALWHKMHQAIEAAALLGAARSADSAEVSRGEQELQQGADRSWHQLRTAVHAAAALKTAPQPQPPAPASPGLLAAQNSAAAVTILARERRRQLWNPEQERDCEYCHEAEQHVRPLWAKRSGGASARLSVARNTEGFEAAACTVQECRPELAAELDSRLTAAVLERLHAHQALQPQPATQPRAQQTTQPRAQPGLKSMRSGAAVPAVARGAAPKSTSTAPEPRAGTAPEPSTSTAPEPSTSTAPADPAPSGSTEVNMGYQPCAPLWLSGPSTPEIWPYTSCWYQVEDWELRSASLQAELATQPIFEAGFPHCERGDAQRTSTVVEPATNANIGLVGQLWGSSTDTAAVSECHKYLGQGAQTNCSHAVQSTSSALGSWRCSHSPLQIAVCKGFAGAVSLLLEQDADMNGVSEGGETALGMAVLTGHSALVKLLLHKGADPGIPNLVGRTAVHHAATRSGVAGSTEIMCALLEAGAAADTGDLVGWTPLHAAMSLCSDRISGSPAVRGEMANLLLEAKADVNQPTSVDGVCPLHVAAFYDTEWDVLLLAGADTQLKDAAGRRAIDIAHTMAPRMGYVESRSIVPNWLSPHTDHRQLLTLLEKIDAGFQIDPEATAIARRAHRLKPSPEQRPRPSPGQRPRPSSGQRHSPTPELGSKQSRRHAYSPSREGAHSTPLEAGPEAERVADNTVATRNLYWAAYHRSYDKMLDAIQAGADVNSVKADTRERSALHWAVTNNHVAGVQLLLEHAADPNASSTWHRTPLMLAAAQNSQAVCSLLIEHGAALGSSTQAGHTAAAKARLSGHKELGEWLDGQNPG